MVGTVEKQVKVPMRVDLCWSVLERISRLGCHSGHGVALGQTTSVVGLQELSLIFG